LFVPASQGSRLVRTLLLVPLAILLLGFFFLLLPTGAWRLPLLLSASVLAVALLIAIAYPGSDE
jgi:hypothetical protein